MTDDILFKELPGKGGNIGEIRLNRVKALNALNHEMFISLTAILDQWEQNDAIKAVVICSESERAFCSGGDVRWVYEHDDDVDAQLKFFQDEYALNKKIFHYRKPYISFLDGLTMGGGAGISIHGSHRVATENFVFAMPETLIGFYPDIGAADFLNKCPNHLGMYLGLTGCRINTADAFACNLVNHVVPRHLLSSLLHTLCESEFTSEDKNVVSNIINRFQSKSDHSGLLATDELISHCFNQSSVEAILDELTAVNTTFSNQVVRDLLTRCPISLKVTHALLNQAKAMEFDALMQLNYLITHHFLTDQHFFEGVRAMLIDKDKKPHWQPAQLAEVTDEMVRNFFSDF